MEVAREPWSNGYETRLVIRRLWVQIPAPPGLMVMRGDSCSEGCGFKSQHRKLDGHFSHVFFVKNCNVCLKR